MTKVKISISLDDEDVRYLDGLHSTNRSEAIHRVIERARESELEADYTEAFAEWASSDDAGLWDAAAADGVV